MTFDIVLAGVGGQGVLSLSNLIARGAAADGLQVKQSEVHGMSQRGGSVTTHLRLSTDPIESPLIARGAADMLLGLEPLEALRYLDYLVGGGVVVSSTDPVRNIPTYPDLESVIEQLQGLPRVVLVQATALARAAGLTQATNVVLAGAASRWLPVRAETLEEGIRGFFTAKGEEVVARNLAAFRSGQEISCTATPLP